MRSTRNDIFLVMLLAVLGCQREAAPVALDHHQQPRAEAKAGRPAPLEPEGEKGEPADTSRLRIETWDFGIIPPRTELSTSVEVVFRAGDRDGDVYQAIMVELAETNAPVFQLAMKGEIRGLLSPSPPSVDFGRVSTATRLSRSIHLRNYSDQDVTITKIEAPDWLQTEAQPVDDGQPGSPPRQKWQITVTADLPKFKVSEAATLVVHTNAAKIDPVVIPVHVEIRPPLEVVPNRLDFHIVPAGRSNQQALMLDVSREFGDLSEKDLVLTHNLGEELKVQVSKMGSQNRFRLMGIFLPRGSMGAVQGELEIKLHGKTAPPVRVPISALVR